MTDSMESHGNAQERRVEWSPFDLAWREMRAATVEWKGRSRVGAMRMDAEDRNRWDSQQCPREELPKSSCPLCICIFLMFVYGFFISEQLTRLVSFIN